MARASQDLSIDYAISDFVPGAQNFPDQWAQSAKDWREFEYIAGRARLNLRYGDRPRNQLDLFLPSGKPIGLMMFVHGGYWHMFDNKSWSHLTRGATQNRWAVAVPSYTLAPDAQIGTISQDIGHAIGFASDLVDGPIRLVGHSAGGHLVCRMACPDANMSKSVANRIDRVFALSPVTDLEPLLSTDMNSVLKLDKDTARLESPLNYTPRPNVDVHILVGSEERPSFLHQANRLIARWPDAALHVLPGIHHFDNINPLADPASPLTRRILES